MADAVTSQVLLDGPKNLVMRFTNASDGTGEAAVDKVDPAALAAQKIMGVDRKPVELVIDKVDYHTFGMSVEILWDATADVRAALVPESESGSMDFCKVGGVPNNAGAGKTGKIQFTTVGHATGDRYDITLYMRKKY